MIRTLLIAAVTLPLLGGCVIYSNEGGERVSVRVADAAPLASAATLETVRSAAFEGQRLNVRVDSNGCTEAASFEVQVTAGDPADITLTRRSADMCKALVPDGVVVSWTYDELGLAAGQAARVLNPVRL